MTYSFFEEPNTIKKPIKNVLEANRKILGRLQSWKIFKQFDFNTFYKVFPMKDYATQLKERQNIDKSRTFQKQNGLNNK